MSAHDGAVSFYVVSSVPSQIGGVEALKQKFFFLLALGRTGEIKWAEYVLVVLFSDTDMELLVASCLFDLDFPVKRTALELVLCAEDINGSYGIGDSK